MYFVVQRVKRIWHDQRFSWWISNMLHSNDIGEKGESELLKLTMPSHKGSLVQGYFLANYLVSFKEAIRSMLLYFSGENIRFTFRNLLYIFY